MEITIQDFGIGHRLLLNGVLIPVKDHDKYISKKKLDLEIWKNRVESTVIVGKTFKTRVEETFAYDDESFTPKEVISVSKRFCVWKYINENKTHKETKREFYNGNRPYTLGSNNITVSPVD